MEDLQNGDTMCKKNQIFTVTLILGILLLIYLIIDKLKSGPRLTREEWDAFEMESDDTEEVLPEAKEAKEHAEQVREEQEEETEKVGDNK